MAAYGHRHTKESIIVFKISYAVTCGLQLFIKGSSLILNLEERVRWSISVKLNLIYKHYVSLYLTSIGYWNFLFDIMPTFNTFNFFFIHLNTLFSSKNKKSFLISTSLSYDYICKETIILIIENGPSVVEQK